MKLKTIALASILLTLIVSCNTTTEPTIPQSDLPVLVLKQDDIILEYGKAVDSQDFVVSGSWDHLDVTPVDPFTLGEQVLEITVQKNGYSITAEKTIMVVDTEPPHLTGVRDINHVAGNDPYYFTQTSYDNVDGVKRIEVEGDIDWNTVGEYHVTAVARDSSGNESREDFIIYVNEQWKSEPFTINGKPLPTITTPETKPTDPITPPLPTEGNNPVVVTKEVVETVVITFKTSEQPAATLEKGKTKTITEGKNGTKEVTYLITYTDGKETSKVKKGEKVTVQPIDKVIAVGTKEVTTQPPVKPTEPVKPKDPVVTTKNVTTTEVIKFTTKKINDATLEKGKEVVSTKGMNGEKTIVTEITYSDGKQTGSKVISSTVTKKPVEQVLRIGTMETNPNICPNGWEKIDPTKPCDYKIQMKPDPNYYIPNKEFQTLQEAWDWADKHLDVGLMEQGYIGYAVHEMPVNDWSSTFFIVAFHKQ